MAGDETSLPPRNDSYSVTTSAFTDDNRLRSSSWSGLFDYSIFKKDSTGSFVNCWSAFEKRLMGHLFCYALSVRSIIGVGAVSSWLSFSCLSIQSEKSLTIDVTFELVGRTDKTKGATSPPVFEVTSLKCISESSPNRASNSRFEITRYSTLNVWPRKVKRHQRRQTSFSIVPVIHCNESAVKVCHPPRKEGRIEWWATTPKVQVPARWHCTHNFWCRTLMYLFVRYNRQLLIPHIFCWVTGTCRGAIYTRCWTTSTINCKYKFLNQVLS